MEPCGDCGSVLASFGFSSQHSATMLADVVQFAAAKMEQVLGKRMVIGVLCGPREGIGGYVLHGTGVTSCTSPAAMDALSSSVDGVVQALQLVASSTDLAASLDVVNVGDVDMHLDEVAPMRRAASPPPESGCLSGARRHPSPSTMDASTTSRPEPSPAPVSRPPSQPADGSTPVPSASASEPMAQPQGDRRRADGGSNRADRSALPPSAPRRSSSPAVGLPALIPWLTKLPERVQITSEATGRLTEPVADDRAPYHITDRVVKDVTDALAVQRKERGGDNKERLVELVALYRFNVIKRTRVQYTFEKCTPEVARGATIIWWKGKKKYEVKDPRFCNSASVRVIPILSIFLLMIHLRDPAFMAILRHYKGGALADESAAARKSVQSPTNTGTKAVGGKRKKRKAKRALSDGDTDDSGAPDTDADDATQDTLQGRGAAASSGSGAGTADAGSNGTAAGSGGGDAAAGSGGGAAAARDEGGDAAAWSGAGRTATDSGGDNAAARRGGGVLPAGGRQGDAGAGNAGGGATAGEGGSTAPDADEGGPRTSLAGVATQRASGGSGAVRGDGVLATQHDGSGLGAATPAGGQGLARAGHTPGGAAGGAAATSPAAALQAAEELAAPLVAASVHVDGALVGTGLVCPGMDEYHGSVLSPDVVSVFLQQVVPAATSSVYPFSTHTKYCLEPTGAGPVRSTLAQCQNMRSVWSLQSIGYEQSTCLSREPRFAIVLLSHSDTSY